MSRSARRSSAKLKPTIQAVVFDVGRVIVDLDPRRILAALGPSASSGMKISPEKVWAIIQADPWWNEWQMGRVSSRDWAEHLMGLFDVRITFDQFRDAWNSVILPDPILPDLLFARLSDKCRLVLLSNTDPLHVEYLVPRFSFYRYFHYRVLSCRIGAIKPGPLIFQAAIQAAGVPARNILFIDDVMQNVAAARLQGLHGLQFQNRVQLEFDLRSFNLL
jgi:FMN phosphatase YigB (HAD superfamily)